MTIFTIDTDPEQKFLKRDNVSKVCLERGVLWKMH